MLTVDISMPQLLAICFRGDLYILVIKYIAIALYIFNMATHFVYWKVITFLSYIINYIVHWKE